MFSRIHALAIGWRRRLSRTEWLARALALEVEDDLPAGTPGLLLIQIDGLSREQLDRGIKRGRMPFLRSLLRTYGYKKHAFYSGLPSSTPAVQAEVHYGERCAVPAFSFLDRETERIAVMRSPEWAKKVEGELAAKARGLLEGGTSWSNIYTGGAHQRESHFCGASIGLGDMIEHVRLRTVFAIILAYSFVFVRLFGLLALEILLGLRDAFGGIFRGHGAGAELRFLVARVFVCIGLRELVMIGASLDVVRGMPVVHANFLGYDEQSHRRGPDSRFAHWTLKGIDRCIRRLYRAASRSSRRDYDVWIFSDHGQARVTQAGQEVEGGLDAIVARHWPRSSVERESSGMRATRRPSPGRWIGHRWSDRREASDAEASHLSVFEKQVFATAAMGPVGHIYPGEPLTGPEKLELARRIVADGVPGILIQAGAGCARWITKEGERSLPDCFDDLPHRPELRREVAEDLVRLCHHRSAGELIALGFGLDGRRWTFVDENGAHAGPAPEEVEAFALLPEGVWLPDSAADFFRPSALREAALHLLGRTSDGDDEAKEVVRRRPPPARNGNLRLVTYNVHGCRGLDGRVDVCRIARVLDRIDADVIALQEIDRNRVRSGHQDQAAMIAEELGMRHQFFPSVTWGEEAYGNALLTRGNLELIRHERLPRSPNGTSEPRSAARVRVVVGRSEFDVVVTHLGLRSGERRAQISALLGDPWLGGEKVNHPLVICGDMNFTARSTEYRMLASHLNSGGKADLAGGRFPTFPSFTPLRQLDHILVNDQWSILEMQAVRGSRPRIASDHLPLAADLTLR